MILVGAYGCHSFPKLKSYKDHPLYNGNKDAFLTAYLAERRDDELAVLRRLVPSSVPSGRPVLQFEFAH